MHANAIGPRQLEATLGRLISILLSKPYCTISKTVSSNYHQAFIRLTQKAKQGQTDPMV